MHGAVPLRAAFLDVRGATKAFGAAKVLDGVDLGVARGEFVSLLGPSGCGKTTLLRIVAGLLRADAGQVMLDGEEVSASRRIAAAWAWCSRATRCSRI